MMNKGDNMQESNISGKGKILVPLPASLAGLPTIEAEPWFRIDSGTGYLLEGPAFDAEGNLFVTSPPTGTVFKITPHKQMTVVFDDRKVTVDGSAFHKDGRLFIVCLSGEILVLSPGNYRVTLLHPEYHGKGLSMNDVVFDAKGNLFVTDFTGTVMEPTGGVFRVSSDGEIVQPVVLHLASPNGISFSPEGDILWVGESTRNTVTRIRLLKDGVTVSPVVGVLPVYYSEGVSGPDSNKVDSAGNLYQCITGQGRIIVLNAFGVPVANVVVPGRDEGLSLSTTNLAFKPGTREAYITASGSGGAWIYKFTGLAEGLPLFSHTTDWIPNNSK
jgi:lactonase